MIYHVLPGDSLIEEFRKTHLEGEVIVCREALVTGPIDAVDIGEFWQRRARYVLAEYGEDEFDYHEKVAAELEGLAEIDENDEVNLWFEYELFCSVNMWFCLSLVGGSGAAVYRVEPIGLNELNRWDGFGQFDADALSAAMELRTRFSVDDLCLGSDLWRAFQTRDHRELRRLGSVPSVCFPYLAAVTAAAVEQDVEPVEVVRAIMRSGERDRGKIFAEFRKRAGVYGYGDAQVDRIVASLES